MMHNKVAKTKLWQRTEKGEKTEERVEEEAGLVVFTVSCAGAGLWFLNAPVCLGAWVVHLF